MVGAISHIAERHLVRAPGAFDRFTVHGFRTRPSFGRTQHQHGPARPGQYAVNARSVLDTVNRLDRDPQSLRHGLMHGLRICALHKIRLITVTDQQAGQFFVTDARQNSRVGDLVAIEMQNWQHRAVLRGI